MAAGAVWQIIELLGEPRGIPIRYTCADVAIPKGTALQITDPRTASAQTGTADAFAGVAAFEKAVDGSLTITAYTKGIFLATSGAAVTVGARLIPATEANKVIIADAAGILKSCVGTALEATAGDAETLAIMLGGY
jgi:hypothetical protein